MPIVARCLKVCTPRPIPYTGSEPILVDESSAEPIVSGSVVALRKHALGETARLSIQRSSGELLEVPVIHVGDFP